MLRTFDDLRKERQHRALRRALRARGAAIYCCDDCEYVWIASVDQKPKRCANRECRAPAQGWKRPAASSEQAAQ